MSTFYSSGPYRQEESAYPSLADIRAIISPARVHGQSIRDKRKRALDLVVTLSVVPIAAGICLVAAILLKLENPSLPVLHRAIRIGEGGRTFRLLKLRTMIPGATGSAITARRDPRVTRVGRFLRDYKLDELPQLWNVMAGEMSLVGPRPEDPTFVDWSDSLHCRVFTALPGITGLSQIRYRHEESLVDPSDPEAYYVSRLLPRKLALDAKYLAASSVRLDVHLIVGTAMAVLRRQVDVNVDQAIRAGDRGN